eukprot:6639727-Pyramimonas_sp.AAC.1
MFPAESDEMQRDLIEGASCETLEPHWFVGLEEMPHCDVRETPFAHIFEDMEIMGVFQSVVCEIAGGQARACVNLAYVM